ncbi:MAG TPA: SIMPL domain-containing protein [Vicinamibacterales bacterium]|nr:SIMPL domain-containing protein [Vicinamibacterales bacterium]
MRTWIPVVASFTWSVAAGAQQPIGPTVPPVPAPQIMVTGTGEARVAPDRAVITIGVFSRATTAAAAARENARRQQAIIDTLLALGFAREQISTMNYNVNPEMRHIPQSGRSEVTGYMVSNNVRVDVRRLDQVAQAIDAALAKGANQINGLDFYVFNADEPRRRALAQAIERARADAESMARAAGGSLGALLEMSTGFVAIPMPRQEMAMAASVRAQADVATPIQPGEDVVRAVVTTRWQFVPGR